MRIKYILLIAMIVLFSSKLYAEVINTLSFKITIPQNMSAKWNKEDRIIATREGKGYLLPILQLEYASSPVKIESFRKQLGSIKTKYKEITRKEEGRYYITTGENDLSVKNRSAYAYLAIIEGPDILVVFTYVTHEKQNGSNAQFNNFIHQIVESNRTQEQDSKT